MPNPKEILVVTTSSVDGLKVKKYLRPISAHIVAGTNLFSDFMGGLTDVFGGRSQAYQKQLASLYNEAILQLQYAAFEIGANCVIGLSIDMDEISGKGKSMFMLTAVGTAAIIENEVIESANQLITGDKLQNVSADRIQILKRKNAIIGKANLGGFILDDETWDFITVNQIEEVFPFLVKTYANIVANEHSDSEVPEKFYNRFVDYIEALPEHKRLLILYDSIKNEQSNRVALKLSAIVNKLQMFDCRQCMILLKSNNFQIQKRGLRLATYDKAFYDKRDLEGLVGILEQIRNTFKERGSRTTKRQMLSSKEREVWLCDCGKTNDIDSYCSGCGLDIFGFAQGEMKSGVAEGIISEKISLISDFLV